MKLVIDFHAQEQKDIDYLQSRNLVRTTMDDMDYEKAYNVMSFLCFFTDQNDAIEKRMTPAQFDLLPTNHTAVFATMRDNNYWMTVKKVEMV